MTQYFALHPASFKLDGGAMFGIIPKPLWSKNCPADESNRIDLALRLILIKTEHHVILIDSGIGDYHDDKFNTRFVIEGEKSPLTECLKHLSLTPLDVTDLVISHLHFDHTGGILENNSQNFIFKNAKIHLHQKHWSYALNPTPRDQGSFIKEYFQPFIEKMDQEKKVLWQSADEGILIQDGSYKLQFKVSFGHTPYLLHPFDQHMIYMADLVPTSHHLPVPWVMGYDINPGQTTYDKMNFYDFIDEKKLTMIFEHDPKFIGSKISWKNHELKSIHISSLQQPIQEIIF